jgi:hypothetical protein
MQRHRPVGRPRHRAKRHGLWPGRGTRSKGARHAAAPVVGPPGEPLLASRQATAEGPRIRPSFGRMIRSAMLTPWFAVSAGLVIAASLTLATPHPALTFPPSKSGRCIRVGCASPSTPAAPAPAIKNEVRLPSRHVRAKVEYQLLRRNHDHFVAAILIVSHRSLNNWRLRFVMLGATIDDIWGATSWRPDGHGVVVSGSPSPWQKSGDNEARIIVFGFLRAGSRGMLGIPTGCTFGNVPCRFRELPTDADHEAGSHESWHRRSAGRILDR